MSTIDAIIVAVSIGIVVVVGLLAARKQDKSAKGYFLASGRMPWWIIGSAFVSTSVSSEQIVGTVGMAYQHGMGIANAEWFSLPAYTLVILLFIPIYFRTQVTTVPDLLQRRFGPLCADVYSWVMMVAYVFVFMVPVLYGGTLAFKELTGWPFQAVLWATVVLVGLYTVKGGLASVMWTDAAQCLMLVGGGVLLFFFALNELPGGIAEGWSAMVDANPQRFHLYLPPDDPYAPFLGLLLATVGLGLFYQATNQVMIQRVLGARSRWDGMMGIIFAGFINFLRPLVTCFLGFIVYHWVHELNHHEPFGAKEIDKVFPFALQQFGPSGLRGIILAGFLAAVMSTISALANSTATILSLDVYKKVLRPDADDREVVKAGKMASIFALFIAGAAAPAVQYMGGIFQYFQTGVAFLSVPFISVILLGILWPRANYQGGLFGTVGGVAIAGSAMGIHLYLVNVEGKSIYWVYSAFVAQVIIVIGIILVSLRYPPPDREKIAPFIWRPSILREIQVSEGRPWYQRVTLWFGIYAAIWFTIYITWW
mgnify:CR=1 FL=1